MELVIDATGTPEQVKNAVATQIKNAGQSTPSAWPMLVNLRDYIGHCIDAQAEPIDIALSVNLSVTVYGESPEHTDVRHEHAEQDPQDTK